MFGKEREIKKLIKQFDQDIESDRVMLVAPKRIEAKKAAEYGEEAVSFLKDALKVSTDAHYALGEIGGDKAFEVLTDELKSYNKKRVNAAATALANMGDMRAIEHIKNSSLDPMRAGDLIGFIKEKNDVSLDEDIDTGRPLEQLKEKWTEFMNLKNRLSMSGGYRYKEQQKQALSWLSRYKEQMETLNFNTTDEKLHAWRMLGILIYYLNNPDDTSFYNECDDAADCFERYLSIKPDEKDIKDMLSSIKKD